MHKQEENAALEDFEIKSELKSDVESVPSSSNSGSHSSRPSNAFVDASFISKICFTWPEQLLKKGMLKPLEEKDLPSLAKEEESRYNRTALEKIWQDEVERVESLKEKLPNGSRKRANSRPSLQRALIVDFLKSTWIIHPFMFARAVAKIAMSVALGFLIQGFMDNSRDGYLWAAVFSLSNVVLLLEYHYVHFINQRKGMQFRIAAISSIFSKSLRLDAVTTTDSTSVGSTINLISNDVERFLLAAEFGPYIMWAPLQAVAVLIVGFYMTGPAFAMGAGLFIFAFIPVQILLSTRYASLRSKVANITDERMNLLSQAIEGVRVMKTSGWENELQNRILNARAREMKQIQDSNRLRALNEGIHFITTALVSATVFVFHVFIFDDQLTARDVFTSLSLISILSRELTKHFPIGVMAFSECWVSVGRIQKYLDAPELGSEHDDESDPTKHYMEAVQANDNEVIRLNNVTCYWDKLMAPDDGLEIVDRKVAALSNVNLSLKKNELTFIVGAVGSGKSALLYALAGEFLPCQGSINRSYSSLAYAPQNPWIMNGTIRENILMGASFDTEFYHKVVEACGLLPDFRNLIDGDHTIVGDKGVQCSGGQNARIGLARALYRDADVLLLDDPLSAVDGKVGRHIFYAAVEGLAVNQGKCVVLATHQLQYIDKGRCAYEMSNGVLKSVGSIEHYIENAVAKDMNKSPVSLNGDLSGTRGEMVQVPNNKERPKSGEHHENRFMSVETSIVEERGKSPSTFESNKSDTSEDKVQFIDGEERPRSEEQLETKLTGAVGRDTFFKYAKSMGSVWHGACLFVSYFFIQGMQLLSFTVMGRWSIMDDQKSWDNLATVLGIVAALVLFAILQSVTSYALTTRASGRLHDAMLSAVVFSKIEFFDVNPSGRILNRFSGDVGSNDELLPSTLHNFLTAAMLVLGTVVMAVAALPFMLCILPPMIWYCLRVRRMFVSTSRELKRFEGLSRSLIFATLNESITGTSTIRSNGAKQFIIDKFEEHHDSHSRAFWSFLASTRFLGFQLTFLMFIFNCSACFIAVLFSEQDWFRVDPVVYGLVLSLLVELGPTFQWTIRVSAEVVNQMVSVERVLEYSELEPEAALTSERDAAAGISWPENGSIEVEEVSVRYRDSLPFSLDSVSFNVPNGKRLGVVGRTGSGKSTLVQALFRLLEAEHGRILIGGVDISDLGLHKLRRGMAVISQNPVLFSGYTVRENLDPFRSFSDEQIEGALIDTQMIQVVNALPFGMDSQIAESGKNFSGGQRQLLCLARAILQKSRILVLDEATANVDGRTDKLLQEAVNRSFRGATIISVAHRLDTVIENDLILVLGAGKVLEFGAPSELISLDGHFTSMVNDTGMSNELKKRAKGSGE